MLGYIKNLLSGGSGNKEDEEKKIQVAACALLVEIASADDHFSDTERSQVIGIMQKTFDVPKDYIEELLELASDKISRSVSLYEFTDIINQNFSREEKLEILLDLWRLIFVDDIMDKYEEFMVRRIASNLKLEHRDLIETKLAARDERKHR